MAKVAEILGNGVDAENYRTIQSKIFNAYNEEFLDKSTGLYCLDSQSAQAMSLVLGLAPPEFETQIFDDLVENFENKWNRHLSTGIVGTYFLYKALSLYGQSDLAYQAIIAKGFPSFEHNLTRIDEKTPLPSTTLWEDWAGVSSLSHPVQGTVVSFFYEWLAGIQSQIDTPGFKKFRIAPQFVGDLQWVKAKLPTFYGVIKSNWEIKGETVTVDIDVPINTTAEMILPCDTVENVSDGKDPIQTDNGILKIETTGNNLQISLGSGTYRFCFPLIRH